MAGKWSSLTPAYRSRLAHAGITEHDYNTKSPRLVALRTKARGHSETPEHPERAMKQPSKYRAYVDKRARIMQRVIDVKHALFKDTLKYNRQRSDNAVRRNPSTKRPPTIAQMQIFLAHVEAGDFWEWWDTVQSEDDFSFLFYH